MAKKKTVKKVAKKATKRVVKKKAVQKVEKKPASKATSTVSKSSKKDDALLYALLGFVLNLAIPGVGTTIWGKKNYGIFQLVLFLVGAVLSLIVIGIPLVALAWILALISSVQMLLKATK